MIVATAGHIDHGKTLLVGKLTGIDTDRLPEEKARGISIDLGFAHAELDGALVSFVDVPGHERFIRSMLAGVCAIDAALLVVAADDGVMPQTTEHLDILELLGVDHGIVAITKVDRVAPERIEAVAGEVRELLSRTRLASSPVLPVSSVSGQGLPELRGALARLASNAGKRKAEGQNFRLAIDRAFTIAGTGTVVTGTVFNGSVSTGDRLVVSPRGLAVRVRGIQVHGRATERAHAAQRCAVSLSGADAGSVSRGDWLVAPSLHAPTRRLDARVTVLAAEAHALAHWTPVHVHLATADVMGRVAIANAGSIAPGQSALVQLVLAKPLGALRGDRFVLRDPSLRRTLGGGTVVDPFAPARRRGSPARLAELAALEREAPEDVLAGLLDAGDAGVDLERFARVLNLTAERAAQAQQGAHAVVLGKEPPIAVSGAFLERLQAKIVDTLRAFHAADPQAAGMASTALHRASAPALRAPAFHAVLREQASRHAIALANDMARLPGHDTTSNPQDAAMWAKVRGALSKAGATAPTVAELATALGVKEPALRDFLHRKSRGGELVRVGTDRFYLRESLAALATIAHRLAASTPGGLFGAAAFRDAVGTGRGLAIQVLECFDRLGVTQRIGDNRRAGKAM
ncbi:MAG TPA: selenocysteine-specific translation elongation factor [Usitatibacter sp.]|nr:selenocysteine-specific translation elongation factor [Usitatibacter sp.]